MEAIPEFVQSLGSLGRGPLAELRRSLAFEPGTYPPAYPYVERYVRRERDRPWFYLAGGLFALGGEEGRSVPPPAEGRAPSFGSAVAELYSRRDQSASIEHRFVALLDADEEQLPHRLRQMVTLLVGEGVPIAWTQLLTDLVRWTDDRRYIQQRWARDFYRVDTESAASGAAEG